jgi:hypothetical protein
MAKLPVYKTQDVKEVLSEAGSGPMAHIKPGEYKAVITNSELKDTKSGSGQYLQLSVVLTEGEYRDTELVERLNVINDNQTAVKIAYETLARIANAVGLTTMPEDSSAIHNKPFIVKIIDEEGKPYIDNNGISQEGKVRSAIDSRGYKALPTVGNAESSKVSESTNQAMPWQN